MRFLSYFSLLIGLLFSAHAEDKELTVYSHRHYEVDKQLFSDFEDKTGIKVKVVKAKADQLIKRLELEGEKTPCDLFITADAGRIWRAKQKGLLQPAKSPFLQKSVPKHLRGPEFYWYGLTARARIIVYAKDRVKPEELSTYEDLIKPKWKGKILVRSSSNIYNQSLLASVIAHRGSENAKTWAAGIVKNMARKPKGNDRDQIKAVVAGEGDIAIVNSYYLGLLLNSDVEAEREVAKKVGIFFPNQNERGTHINVSAAGVTKHSDNPEAAVKLLEFLVSEEAQKVYAKANYEYPVNSKVEMSALLKSWGTFKPDKINLDKLGKHNKDAVKIFDIVQWR